MSVTFLTNGHIDVLINGLRQFGCPAPDTPLPEYRGIGRALWDAAADRYNNRYAASTRPSYVLHITSEELDPLAVLSAIEFYEGTAQTQPECLTSLREVILRRHPHLTPNPRTGIPPGQTGPFSIPRHFHDLTEALARPGAAPEPDMT